MSVIVKGMKFPENCLKCDLRAYDANAGEEYCPFTQVECLSIGRQDACPLVELPEKHGRLIDADETLKRYCTGHCRKKPSCEEDCFIYDLMHLEKPVIEAEGNE